MARRTGFIIAIDGPAASGKGTVASKLAKELDGFYLNSGAFYRSVALLCMRGEIDLKNENLVGSVLDDLDFKIEAGKVFLNGEDVTERIKKPDTASGASVVGVYPEVRKKGAQLQKAIAEKAVNEGSIVVAEGRDMGTTVFPEASFKVFLTARIEVRAKRRMEQYLDEKDLKEELAALRARDMRDSGRSESPLPSDPERLGYFVLDNSDMNEAETLEVIKKELEKEGLV